MVKVIMLDKSFLPNRHPACIFTRSFPCSMFMFHVNVRVHVHAHAQVHAHSSCLRPHPCRHSTSKLMSISMWHEHDMYINMNKDIDMHNEHECEHEPWHGQEQWTWLHNVKMYMSTFIYMFMNTGRNLIMYMDHDHGPWKIDHVAWTWSIGQRYAACTWT